VDGVDNGNTVGIVAIQVARRAEDPQERCDGFIPRTTLAGCALPLKLVRSLREFIHAEGRESDASLERGSRGVAGSMLHLGI
jgi:hypothetical protein